MVLFRLGTVVGEQGYVNKKRIPKEHLLKKSVEKEIIRKRIFRGKGSLLGDHLLCVGVECPTVCWVSLVVLLP